MPSWLPLLNYSTKYNISLSTLRRRIKARSIEFKLDQGKYLILDESAHSSHSASHTAAHVPAPKKSEPRVTQEVIQSEMNHSNFVEASVLTSANRLVEEIKSAYAKILQEKEEQISQLKEEIVDLRMLVRILEDTSRQSVSTEIAQKKPDEVSTGLSGTSDSEFIFSDFQNRNI